MLTPSDLRRLERALSPLVDAVRDLLAVQMTTSSVQPAPPALVTRDTMLVAHLELQHLGRWIYLPGRPAKLGPKVAAEPSVVAQGGRLVGIRPGAVGKSDQPGTRVLVLQQGSALAELSVSVADLVDVAPREW